MIVVRGNDDRDIGIFLMQCYGHGLKVARVKCHCDRKSGALMDTCAGCKSFADDQTSVRPADTEVGAAYLPARQKPLAAIRPDGLQAAQRARGVAHGDHQPFPVALLRAG
jgi:hypothetical protein